MQVEASKDDEVQIVLDNASITSKISSAINGVKAKKLTITLQENSVNYISDAQTYTTFTDEENEEPNGAIYTKTDLVINGSGKLVVNANYEDGIVCKDGLKIINSTIEVKANDDGIRGKDYVAIKDANINITSEGDGIKSNNDTDESLGYIKIEGGSITINAGNDGIQAENILNISENTNINIKTTGEITKTKSEGFGPMERGGFGNSQITSNVNTTTVEENSTSSKGLKAGKEITIESGSIEISSTDDGIHSNGKVIINGGTISVTSSDDGIHADGLAEINGGTFNITAAEGIEATYVKINDGTININASDDGINAGNKSKDYSVTIEINGGYITIKMGQGDTDGIDSNGNLYINGGTIDITGNSPFDYDGTAEYNGGTIIVNGEQTNQITNQFMGRNMNGGMNVESQMNKNGGEQQTRQNRMVQNEMVQDGMNQDGMNPNNMKQDKTRKDGANRKSQN